MKEENRHVVPIILALVIAIAPHTPGLPLWINAWCLIMWGYMLVRLKTGWPLPGGIFRHFLAFAGLAGLILTYKTRLDSNTFVGLMAVMAAVKPFETATHRHRMITILLTYFIIITSLFQSDSLWILLYMFFSVLVTTISLIRINDLTGRFRASLALACRIMGQALPLVILLFFLFPRLQDGVFGMKDIRRGRTGFSERLTPGSVSGLARDNSTAFRVQFKTLPAGGLYWRGIVFEQFNGKSWLPAEQQGVPAKASPGSKELFPHTIILEPHHSRWLFGLDVPVQVQGNALITQSHTLRSRWKIRRKTTYRVISRPGPVPDPGRVPLISIDPDSNPGTRRLARDLAMGAPGVEEKIQRILDFFKTNGFIYTLSPGRIDADSLDHFLLENKKGYCEHYASAFAFMMNVLGVPARVVGGYLGGELNPYANHLIVRQSSAHAWAEVFVPDRGWIRIDPTLSVSPERIFQNPDGSPARTSLDRISIFKKLEYLMESINLRWEAWFTGFSHEAQKALLQRLGILTPLSPAKTMALFLGGTGLVLVLFFLFLRRIHGSSFSSRDPVKKAYLEFCRRLARAGLPPKAQGQGAVDYASRICRERPDLKFEVERISDLYVRIRFHRNSPEELKFVLKKRIKEFKPRPDG
ncbi:transglutaminase TgpA family protein [Desulfospira joergensenii]|uniref:transglutaminase TgpA family protein n=1 Tax=Desulfospira joergensenii TaxID=53329 RepID=UPI0003B71542|nr:DUF3488 and transglutaminase-like domain-containing protein [Desulfospira joergensenii]